MSKSPHAVSIHPYFKVNEGRLDDFKKLITKFIERTRTEETCYYYDFSVSGDTVFCREAYAGAAGLLAHLENVGAQIEEALTMSDLVRLEVHGPAADLAQLKEPLAALSVTFYAHVAGL